MSQRPRTRTPAEEMRLFAGLAVQPFIAAGVAFFSFPFVMLDHDGRTARGGYISDPTQAAIGLAIYVFVAVVVVTAFVVFPAAVWLLKRRLVSLTLCLAIGLGLGNLPMVIGTMLSGGSAGLVRSHMFVSLIGITGAAVFWIISVRGRDFSRIETTRIPSDVAH